jgi:hypothetical protein
MAGEGEEGLRVGGKATGSPVAVKERDMSIGFTASRRPPIK